MYCFSVHGLVVHSEIFFPELIESNGIPDAFICFEKIEQPSGSRVSINCLQANAQEVHLFWDEVGMMLVRNGREIIVDAIPDIELDKLRIFLLGIALAVLLHQRGLLILHASAVAINGGIVAFIGDKGWGKSTTTAALHQQGHSMVTDDLLVLDMNQPAAPIVFPGFPQLKLFPDSASAVGHAPATLRQLYSTATKYARRITDGFTQTPLPLDRIYVLGVGSVHAIEPIHGQSAFTELVRHSFVAKILQATDTAQAHFQHCAELARYTPVYQLQRQPSLQDLPVIVQLIEQHCAYEKSYAKAI
jgi:hypothetical protein